MTAAAPPPPAAQAAVARKGFVPTLRTQDPSKPRPSVRARAARTEKPRMCDERVQTANAVVLENEESRVLATPEEDSRARAPRMGRVASLYSTEDFRDELDRVERMNNRLSFALIAFGVVAVVAFDALVVFVLL